MATLRGVLRQMEASARRAERDSIRRQKELNKMLEYQHVSYEVEKYENYINVLQTMHEDCSEKIDWNQIKNLIPPSVPVNSHEFEKGAKDKLQNYKPNIFHKLFGRVEKIQKNLEEGILICIKMDEEEYKNDVLTYENDKKEWEEDVNLAESILIGDLESYKEAINKLNPFSEIGELGTGLSINFHNKDIIEVNITVHSEEIIPSESKSLLKSGKLSIKSMPISRFNEIYQDYICSSVLRIARETFAILPIKEIIVTAYSNLLNKQTGYKEDAPILSVLMPNETLNKLNFSGIDPSDSMRNFVHNMDFKKTTGFCPVEKISIEDYAT